MLLNYLVVISMANNVHDEVIKELLSMPPEAKIIFWKKVKAKLSEAYSVCASKIAHENFKLEGTLSENYSSYKIEIEYSIYMGKEGLYPSLKILSYNLINQDGSKVFKSKNSDAEKIWKQDIWTRILLYYQSDFPIENQNPSQYLKEIEKHCIIRCQLIVNNNGEPDFNRRKYSNYYLSSEQLNSKELEIYSELEPYIKVLYTISSINISKKADAANLEMDFLRLGRLIEEMIFKTDLVFDGEVTGSRILKIGIKKTKANRINALELTENRKKWASKKKELFLLVSQYLLCIDVAYSINEFIEAIIYELKDLNSKNKKVGDLFNHNKFRKDGIEIIPYNTLRDYIYNLGGLKKMKSSLQTNCSDSDLKKKIEDFVLKI